MALLETGNNLERNIIQTLTEYFVDCKKNPQNLQEITAHFLNTFKEQLQSNSSWVHGYMLTDTENTLLKCLRLTEKERKNFLFAHGSRSEMQVSYWDAIKCLNGCLSQVDLQGLITVFLAKSRNDKRHIQNWGRNFILLFQYALETGIANLHDREQIDKISTILNTKIFKLYGRVMKGKIGLENYSYSQTKMKFLQRASELLQTHYETFIFHRNETHTHDDNIPAVSLTQEEQQRQTPIVSFLQQCITDSVYVNIELHPKRFLHTFSEKLQNSQPFLKETDYEIIRNSLLCLINKVDDDEMMYFNQHLQAQQIQFGFLSALKSLNSNIKHLSLGQIITVFGQFFVYDISCASIWSSYFKQQFHSGLERAICSHSNLNEENEEGLYVNMLLTQTLPSYVQNILSIYPKERIPKEILEWTQLIMDTIKDAFIDFQNACQEQKKELYEDSEDDMPESIIPTLYNHDPINRYLSSAYKSLPMQFPSDYMSHTLARLN